MPRSAFSRRPPTRSLGPKFLIACEGDSEEAYLEDLRQSLRLSKNQIIVLNEKGTDPLTIVRTVLLQRQGMQKEGLWVAGDTAWAALDGDEHRDNNADNWYQSLDLAQAHQIHFALSNPSLELWYLLHFQDQEAPLHRDKASAELEKHLPSYKKPVSLYSELKSSAQDAIARAARLDQRNLEKEASFYNNPCSGMGKLVAQLLQLQR